MAIRLFTLLTPFYVVDKFGDQFLFGRVFALPFSVTTPSFVSTLVLRALVER